MVPAFFELTPVHLYCGSVFIGASRISVRLTFSRLAMAPSELSMAPTGLSMAFSDALLS